MAGRGTAGGKAGHRHPWRRRAVHEALLEDGDRHGQDHRDDHAHRLADAEQGHLPPGHEVLEELPRRRPGADRAEPAGRSSCPTAPATTTTSSTSSRRAWSTACGKGGSWCGTGTPWAGTPRSRSPSGGAWTSGEPRATKPTSAKYWARWLPARNILVINDEAHHAWRVPTESKVKGLSKADIEEATKWVGSLDRIHRTRGILDLPRLQRHAVRPLGEAEFRGSPVRVDRERLRAERRHRVGAGQDPTGRGP